MINTPADKARRKISGALAKHAGDSFENLLSAHHILAVHSGRLAWMRHVSPKMRMVGSGAKARWIAVGTACCDYVGQAFDGRAIVVEAKSRRVKDGPLYEKDIEPHQLLQLTRCAHAGGIAVLAVEFRGEASVERFAIPWVDVPWRIRRKAPGVDAEDLVKWHLTGGMYLERFLAEGK